MKKAEKENQARKKLRDGTKWREKSPFPGASGKVFQISAVTPNNVSFGYAPGEPGICGGAHCPKEWVKRVASGRYIIVP